jgi:hypothetical protein
MRRLEDEAGIDLSEMALARIAGVTARIFETVSSHPLEDRPELDWTLSDASQRRHAALVRAVEASAAAWPDEDRTVAAATFDVLWRAT